MAVGIDYLPAVTHWPGVGRYARELVRALVRLPDCPELRLLEWGAEARAIEEPWLGLAGAPRTPRRLRVHAPRRVMDLFSRTLGIGADRWLGGVELFHRVHAHWPPVRRALELQPVPELPPGGSAAEAELGERLRGMAGCLVASAHCAAELERRFGIRREQIYAVATGCDHWRRELRGPARSVEPVRLVVLGGVRPERRHAAILAAFELLVAGGEAGELVLVGPEGSASAEFREKLARSPARERVTRHAQPVEEQMPAILAGAAALVHLSEGEETPVTPLEACSFGCAVLASRLPAFEEALGREAHYVDGAAAAADPAELARAISAAIGSGLDPAARARREALAAGYSWERNARETLAVWRGLLGT